MKESNYDIYIDKLIELKYGAEALKKLKEKK